MAGNNGTKIPHAFRYGINNENNNNINNGKYIYPNIPSCGFFGKNRESLISQEIEAELYPYICGACINRKHHVHAIGGTHDHIHMLIGMHPSESISDLVKALKIQSTLWIKEKFGVANFTWQSGFAAFSYSKSQLPQVINYINHQKEHHKVVSFDNEMETIMERSGLDYNKDYLLKGID